MIITRRIEVKIDTEDKELKKGYYDMLSKWSEALRRGANLISSHRFFMLNMADFQYVKDDAVKRVFTKDLLKEERGNSETNFTYRIIAKHLKPENVPTDCITTMNTQESGKFRQKQFDYATGRAAIPSYRNMPIPFSGKVFDSLHTEKRTNKDGNEYDAYVMTFLRKIPLQLYFGRDRSGNRTIINRALKPGTGYKLCSSKLEISDKKSEDEKKFRKLFLLISIDIPVKETKLDDKKTLYARLSVFQPILCSENKEDLENENAGMPLPEDIKPKKGKKENKSDLWYIGTKEEFLHRRIQIQEARRRAQKAAKYNKGGHGRKKKCASLDRYSRLEKNYCGYKTHVYSAELVKRAMRKGCATIRLMNADEFAFYKEKKSEDEKAKFILRNWSYYDLKNKVEYKAKKYGIKVVSAKEKNEEETED